MITLEELKKTRYNNCLNYKIVNISNKKRCYIFCSSNGIYSNTSNQPLNRDYYEWENIAKNRRLRKCAGKYIFIRDPQASFYIEGINKYINTIDKITKLIEKETEGFEVIIIGFSSGGYLAMIFGNVLSRVKRVFCFGGIVSLYSFTGAKNDYSYTETAVFKKHKQDIVYNKYYSLLDLLDNNKSQTLYFYGIHNICDQIQLKEMHWFKDFYLLPIDSDRHGADFYGFCYPYLFSASDKRINKIIRYCSTKKLNKREFAIITAGIFHTIIAIFHKLCSAKK